MIWIQANFGVKKQLPSSVAASIPKLDLHQIEAMISEQKQRKSNLLGINTSVYETTTLLCGTCGCNHRSEECPAAGVMSPAILPVTGDLPTPYDLQNDHLLGKEQHHVPDIPGMIPLANLNSATNGVEDDTDSPHDTFFVAPSPMEYENAFSHSKESLTNSPVKSNGGADYFHMDSIMAKKQYKSHEVVHVDWTDTLPTQIVEHAFEAWAQLMHAFHHQQDLTTLEGSLWKAETISRKVPAVGSNEVLAVLHQILCCRTTNLELIEKTNMSRSMALLCSSSHSDISSKAKQIVTRWRQCAVAALIPNQA